MPISPRSVRKIVTAKKMRGVSSMFVAAKIIEDESELDVVRALSLQKINKKEIFREKLKN